MTKMVVIGDSITAANPSWEQEVALSYNSGDVHLWVYATGGDTILSDMDASVVSATRDNAEIIIVQLGINDNNAGDMGALQAEAEENIAELKADHPRATVYWFVLPSYESNSPGAALVDKANIRTAVSAACTAQGATYWDSVSTPWIDPEDTVDGIHPTTAGYTKVATQVLARL